MANRLWATKKRPLEGSGMDSSNESDRIKWFHNNKKGDTNVTCKQKKAVSS